MTVGNFKFFIKKRIGKPFHEYLTQNSISIPLNLVYTKIVNLYGLKNFSDIKYCFGKDDSPLKRNVYIDINNLVKSLSEFGLSLDLVHDFFIDEVFLTDDFTYSEMECFNLIFRSYRSLTSRCISAAKFIALTKLVGDSKFIKINGLNEIWSRFTLKSFFYGRTFYRSKCLELCAISSNSDDCNSQFFRDSLANIINVIREDFSEIPIVFSELYLYTKEQINHMTHMGLILVKENIYDYDKLSLGVLNINAFEKNHIEKI